VSLALCHEVLALSPVFVAPGARLREMTAANERRRRPQRRQRRRMIGLQHQMARRVDQGPLALRMRAPQHEHRWRGIL